MKFDFIASMKTGLTAGFLHFIEGINAKRMLLWGLQFCGGSDKIDHIVILFATSSFEYAGYCYGQFCSA